MVTSRTTIKELGGIIGRMRYSFFDVFHLMYRGDGRRIAYSRMAGTYYAEP